MLTSLCAGSFCSQQGTRPGQSGLASNSTCNSDTSLIGGSYLTGRLVTPQTKFPFPVYTCLAVSTFWIGGPAGSDVRIALTSWGRASATWNPNNPPCEWVIKMTGVSI